MRATSPIPHEPAADHPVPIVTMSLPPVRVQVVGAPPAVAEAALERLISLRDGWDLTNRHGDLTRLRDAGRGVSVPVAPETLLLLGLAADAGLPGGSHLAFDYPAMTVTLDRPLHRASAELAHRAQALAVDLAVADLHDADVWGARVDLPGITRVTGLTAGGSRWDLPLAPSDGGQGSGMHLQAHDLAVATTPHGTPGRRATATFHELVPVVVRAAVGTNLAWRAQALAEAVLAETEVRARQLLATASQAWLLFSDGSRQALPRSVGA